MRTGPAGCAGGFQTLRHRGERGRGRRLVLRADPPKLDPICGLLTHPWTLLTGYGAGNIINAVWAGAAKAGRLLDGLGMNGGAATGFAAGVNADTVWTMCAYTSVIAEYGLIGLAMLVEPRWSA